MRIKTPKIGNRITGPIERGFPDPGSPKHDRTRIRERSIRTQKNRTRRSKSRSYQSKF